MLDLIITCVARTKNRESPNFNCGECQETTCPWWQLTDLEQEYYRQLFEKMNETERNKVYPLSAKVVIGHEVVDEDE